ncbi:cell division protein FtsX, partial [Streptococcus suis]
TATFGETWNLFQGDPNPLYYAYIIDTTEPNYVKSVAPEIAKIHGLTEVRDGEVETERNIKMADVVRNWAVAATGLMLF